MELIVNYPKTEAGIREFNQAVAKFHAILLLDMIDNLNIDNVSKKKVLDGVLETLQFRLKESEDNNKD